MGVSTALFSTVGKDFYAIQYSYILQVAGSFGSTTHAKNHKYRAICQKKNPRVSLSHLVSSFQPHPILSTSRGEEKGAECPQNPPLSSMKEATTTAPSLSRDQDLVPFGPNNSV